MKWVAWSILAGAAAIACDYDVESEHESENSISSALSTAASFVESTEELDKAAATWAEEIFREAPTVEHWGLLRASARGTLRHELLEVGEHLLLIEILLSESKAREALSPGPPPLARAARAAA